MIDGGKLLAVLCCCLLVLHLRGHGRNALLTQCGVFRRQWLASDASRPVVAGAVHRGVVDAAVIHVNVGYVHVVDGAVIVETISAPIPALIADAAVAESIVNAAVIADILAPEAVVEADTGRRRIPNIQASTGSPLEVASPIRRAPRSSPAERSSNIRASTDSHCRGLEAANIPALVAGAVVPEAPAGRSSHPGSRRCRCHRNSSGSVDPAVPLDR